MATMTYRNRSAQTLSLLGLYGPEPAPDPTDDELEELTRQCVRSNDGDAVNWCCEAAAGNTSAMRWCAEYIRSRKADGVWP